MSVTRILILALLSPVFSVAQQPQLLLPVGHSSPVSATCFNNDASLIATTSSDENSVKLWETSSGKLLNTFLHSAEITSIGFSPDGKYLLTIAHDQHAKIWETASGSLYYDISFYYNNWIEKGYFSSDSKKVLLIADNAMEYHDLPGKKMLHRIRDNIEFPNLYGVSAMDSMGRKNWIRISDDSGEQKGFTYTTNTGMSRDGKYAIVSTKDSSIRLWDLQTGQLAREIKEKDQRFANCAITNSGDKILASTFKHEVKIWETAGGKLVQSIPMKSSLLLASFSPDGDLVITSAVNSESGVVEQWDIKTGTLRRSYRMPPTVYCFFMQFSPDSKWLMTASSDGTLRLWDTQTGEQKRLLNEMTAEVKRLLPAVENNDYYKFVNASFSPDLKFIASASINTVISIQELVSGKPVSKLEGISTLIYKPRYSRDGKLLATIGSKESFRIGVRMEGVISIWDYVSGKKIITLEGHKGRVNDMDFSHDNKYLASCADDSTVRVWSLDKGQPVVTLKGHEKGVYKCYFTADDKYLVSQTSFGISRIWEIETGRLIGKITNEFIREGNPDFPLKDNSIYYTRSSRSGKYLLAHFYNDKYLVKEIATGKTLARFDAKKDSLGFFRFGADEKTLIYVEKKKIIVRDIETDLVRATIPYRKAIEGLNLSSKGDVLVVAAADTTLKLWNTGTGQLIADLGPLKKRVSHLDFTSDDRYLTTNAYDGFISVWDVAAGKLSNQLQMEPNDMYGFNFKRQDRYYFVTRSYESIMKVRDMGTGTVLNTVPDRFNPNLVYTLHPSEPQFIIDNNFSIDIYGIGGSKPIQKIISTINGEYLTVDSMDRFDGTEAARKLLYFTCGAEVVELEQLKERLWVPKLFERTLNKETLHSPGISELDICGFTPKIGFTGEKQGLYTYTILPRKGKLGEIILYVNGIEARRYNPGQLSSTNGNYELRVKKEELESFMVPGQENQVMIRAYTADNNISSRGAVITSKAEQKPVVTPNLYAVMIGVSDYKGDELDLKYAAKDATDISNALALSARKLLNTDGKEHVFIYNLTTAKERYQLPEKNAVKKLMEDIGKKATAADVLLIFFAGHGVMAGEGDKKQFYFLTADASTLATNAVVKDAGISTAELTEWMKPQNIKAQKRILVFDACNSGQAIKDFVKMGNADQNYLAARSDDKSQLVKAIDKLNEKSGLFILSAAASDQNAYEMGRYSQGLLTYSLLKVIKQQPDILEEGKYLNISRWFNAAEKTAVEISRETGARQEPQIVSTTNFNIGLVDEEVIGKIVLPEEKPLFAASNFQNSDEAIADDDMELSKMVNLGLSDLSTRGAESRIVYVTATNSPDAYSLTGRYIIKDNAITVTVNLKQNKTIRSKFELSGTKDKLGELATAIIHKATGLVQ